MTVKRILASKGSAAILTIPPSQTVAEAARILSEKGIGALVVSTNGTTISGILSERDVVRAIGKVGPSCLSQTVAELMTASVKTITQDETAVEALTEMTNGRFRHLPVMDGATMVGVISIGDVVKYRIAEMQHENQALTDMIVGHG